MDSTWVGKFSGIVAHVSSTMTSAHGLTKLLTELVRLPNSPLAGSEIAIEAVDGTPLLVGFVRPSEPDYISTILLTGARHARAKLRLWFHDSHVAGDAGAVAQTVGLLREVFDAWWTPDARSPKGDLPTWTDATKRRGQGALTLRRACKSDFTVIFCDLDNFKQVNNELGQAGGDVVIARIASFLEAVVSTAEVVLHHGGDEFVIVLPEGAAHDAIELSSRIISKASGYDFKTQNTPVGFSLGIASSAAFPDATFEELVNRSDEDVLKKLVKKTSAKGAMRVALAHQEPNAWTRSLDPRILALILRSSLGAFEAKPAFASVWLNALVKSGTKAACASSNLQDVGLAMKDSFRTFRFDLGTKDVSFVPYGVAPIFEPYMSALDLAVACARVFFEQFIAGNYSGEHRRLLVRQKDSLTTLLIGDEPIFTIEGVTNQNVDIDLGAPWRRRDKSKQDLTTQIDSSPFILMEIGRNHLRALPKLAADHIVIDDRPGTGGGLPDFWELSLSRLISSLGRFPNVQLVIVVGAFANARNTVEKLQTTEVWDLDYLSYKTAVPKPLVERARDRLSNSIRHCETEEDALEALIQPASAARELLPKQSVFSEEPAILLHRTLDYPRAALNATDGCRVRTAAEAFPLILELLRAGSGDDELILDQDGIQLRELVDFKVVVEDPTREQIPWFFRKEESALSEYFKNQFIASGGRFAEQFRNFDAETRILAHVRWALTRADGPPFATRRALLVIPHAPSERPEAIAPLGLVSVRILPRPSPTETVINFSFTWRTVEALIGFPYSLYGSLRYAQYLCEKIQEHSPAHRIRLGYVSYVANSLHFFISDESRRIARGIVSESSL